MGERFVVDIVTERVLERLPGVIEERVAPVVDGIVADVERRLTDLISAAAPPIPEFRTEELTPIVIDDPKADARDRARRTLLQGLVATIVVAGILAVAGAFQGGFDFLDAGAWKTVAGAAVGAMLAAAGSYIQRFIDPPAGQ